MAGTKLLVRSRKEKRKQKRDKRKKAVDVVSSSLSPPTEDGSTAEKPGKQESNNCNSPEAKPKNCKRRKLASPSFNNDTYAHLDSETALALQREDEEIKDLEAKLGLSDNKEKKRLHKEYASQEGYGEDFGDFLDDLDNLVHRLKSTPDQEEDEIDHMSSDSSSSKTERQNCDDLVNGTEDENEREEETLPMAPPAKAGIARDPEIGKMTRGSEKEQSKHDDSGADEELSDSSESTSQTDNEDPSDDEDSVDRDDSDHGHQDTYRPTQGQDIYGKTIDTNVQSTRTIKYVPPHMRNKKVNPINKDDLSTVAAAVGHSTENEHMKTIRRSLNNSLNRLSEDTLVTVSQSMAGLYLSNPKASVNQCIWENTQNACIYRPHLMTGLTPLYIASIVGVHIQKGDTAQLIEHMIEMTVSELYKVLEKGRENEATTTNDDEEEHGAGSLTKRISNMVLILCYLYNFDVVHCSLMYDVIRDLIQSFTEIDIELLLIVLSHCGRSLRSDDPSALKAIVLDVQKQAVMSPSLHSSRVDYMVSAVTDLKNNKRRQQDTILSEKSSRLRKLLGRIKTIVAASNGNIRANDSSLRITLKDILQAEGKGRWWRVGASWEGGELRNEKRNGRTEPSFRVLSQPLENEEQKESKLLRLAAKYRMNTDVRRSIFCIIMGSADYEDAFEKLVRAGMLKNKAERDTARVLMECCGNEKAFNNFYAHLAKRICEYQNQSKFTFQLAYWDAFKQMGELKPRKASNLAKLLFALVVEHRVLRLGVLKGIDMTSPDDLSNTGMIFMTIFFTNLLEHFDNPSDVDSLFESNLVHQRKSITDNPNDNEIGQAEDVEALYASLTLFFTEVLKSSPKYVKGSKFRTNLKAAIKACDTDSFYV